MKRKPEQNDEAQTLAHALPLPVRAHLPGINQRPQDDFCESIADEANAVTKDANAFDNLAWLYGIRLINHGYYWEAHEVLEPVWMNALPNSRERHLVQGVIHLANAALKNNMGRPAAAKRLVILAKDSFQRAFSGHQADLMGLSRTSLNAAVAACQSEEASITLLNMRYNA